MKWENNVELTPEQQEQVQRAKAAGQQRVLLEFTAQQREEWRVAAEKEMAGKDENIAHMRRIRAAAEQAGFFGDVRRAIILSRLREDDLANQIGVAPAHFSEFRAGAAELPSAALDRLIEALGLRLMQEIPR
jgi:hypothetical protein